MLLALLSATSGLPQPGVYLGWGGVTISLGNFIVIVVMLVLFALALVLPFPGDKGHK